MLSGDLETDDGLLVKDSTLITTASGNTFPKSATDWKWWHANVPTKIRNLNSKGYIYKIYSRISCFCNIIYYYRAIVN